MSLYYEKLIINKDILEIVEDTKIINKLKSEHIYNKYITILNEQRLILNRIYSYYNHIYIEKENIEIDYTREIIPFNVKKENNNSDLKIISGLIIKFDLQNKQISFIDKKINEPYFNKVREYGPYSFEEIGIDDEKYINILKFINEYSKNNDLPVHVEFAKMLIANKEKTNNSLLKEKLLIWGIIRENYEWLYFKELYYKYLKLIVEYYKIVLKNDSIFKSLYLEYINKENELKKIVEG